MNVSVEAGEAVLMQNQKVHPKPKPDLKPPLSRAAPKNLIPSKIPNPPPCNNLLSHPQPPAMSALTTGPPPPSLPSHHPLLPHLHLCTSTLQLKQVHAQALKSAFPPHHLIFLYSRLLHSAAATNFSDLSYAHRLLLHPSFPVAPNSFSFNTLIRAFSRADDRWKRLSLRLYVKMLRDALTPDNHTFPFVFKSCAFFSDFAFGSQLHCQLLKLGFGSDRYVVNSLIHFYSSCGRLSVARDLFDGMPERSRVSWNVMIDGFVMNGEYEAALALFREMQGEFLPDAYTMQSALCACAGLSALSLGMWAHAFVLKKCEESVRDDVLISNSLIDLYAKCGSILLARQVFVAMRERDATSWNAMILGLAMHGRVEESLEAFACMLENGKLRPNSITFVGVLSACNYGGLVSDGRRYFRLMVDEFGIEPQLEHYGCIVDLLARAGHIEEALELAMNMPCRPDVVIWRSLLDACCKQNAGVAVSESVAQRAIETEEVGTSGAYVLLSRIYASANQWNDVGVVRKLMADGGIRKEPGCSSIEIDGVVHEFVAGDTWHPRSEDIYKKLKEMDDRLAVVGYVPDSSQAPLVAEMDGVKCESLRLHSERLAVAFGLLNQAPGRPIRVLKNLRICGDCHEIIKLISRLYCVEIVVRDRVRFHQFTDGSCSCMDYW